MGFGGDDENWYGAGRPVASKNLTERNAVDDRQAQLGDDDRRAHAERLDERLSPVEGLRHIPTTQCERIAVQLTVADVAIDDEYSRSGADERDTESGHINDMQPIPYSESGVRN